MVIFNLVQLFIKELLLESAKFRKQTLYGIQTPVPVHVCLYVCVYIYINILHTVRVYIFKASQVLLLSYIV